MWFQFPQGVNGISVELQHFVPEFKDQKGNNYFRAPDHFAPRILALKGFTTVTDLPEGAPEDLPRADPQRDGAITELTQTVEAQRRDLQNLRSDLGAANARIQALSNDKVELMKKLEDSEALVTGLREQLEDKGVVEVTPTKKGK
jgi:flagellar motility protein MotE (MotC chaperone)